MVYYFFKEDVMAGTTVQVLDSGPILVSGDFELQDGSKACYTLEEGKTIALCRCGQSSNKPFCDSTHRKAGFESELKAE